MSNQLNPHKNIEVITAKSPRGLRNKLRFIGVPFGVKQIYYDSTTKDHVAWISPDRKFSPRFLALLDKIEVEPKKKNDG